MNRPKFCCEDCNRFPLCRQYDRTIHPGTEACTFPTDQFVPTAEALRKMMGNCEYLVKMLYRRGEGE